MKVQEVCMLFSTIIQMFFIQEILFFILCSYYNTKLSLKCRVASVAKSFPTLAMYTFCKTTAN